MYLCIKSALLINIFQFSLSSELSASETGSALLCAVGMTTVMSHDQTPASCILCQEAASNSGDQSFVLSVLVQRSSVMRREEQNISNGEHGTGNEELE